MFEKQKTLNSFRIKGLSHNIVLEAGLEPARAKRPQDFKSGVSTNSTTRAQKSEKRDSNPRPRPWQGRALPTELLSHFISIYRFRLNLNFLAIGAQIY